MKPLMLITGPVATRSGYGSHTRDLVRSLISMDKFDIKIIATYPNSDFGGKNIIEKLKKLKKYKNIHIFSSLGRYYYHGILALNKINNSVVCVGNSSSGIKETAIFKCPVVNIGPRQNGRFRSTNVFDVKYSTNQIYDTILKCIYDMKIRKKCINSKNLYGGGKTGIRITKFIENLKIPKSKILLKKITY